MSASPFQHLECIAKGLKRIGRDQDRLLALTDGHRLQGLDLFQRDLALRGLNSVAGAQTRILQRGYLRYYLIITTLTTVGLAAFSVTVAARAVSASTGSCANASSGGCASRPASSPATAHVITWWKNRTGCLQIEWFTGTRGQPSGCPRRFSQRALYAQDAQGVQGDSTL